MYTDKYKNKREYIFAFDCVSSTAKIINDIKDNSKEITYKTFLKYVSYDHLLEIFPFYDKYPNCGGLMIKNDWCIAYYKSKYKGNTCYYLVHSAIEYVFVKNR